MNVAHSRMARIVLVREGEPMWALMVESRPIAADVGRYDGIPE